MQIERERAVVDLHRVAPCTAFPGACEERCPIHKLDHTSAAVEKQAGSSSPEESGRRIARYTEACRCCPMSGRPPRPVSHRTACLAQTYDHEEGTHSAHKD